MFWSKKKKTEEARPPSPPPPHQPAAPAQRPDASSEAPPTPSQEAGSGSATAASVASVAMRSRYLQLGEIVSLFLKSPQHRHLSIVDLEWMALPPIQLGQVAVAQAQPRQGERAQGEKTPVAAVLWARVSPEIDKRFSSDLKQPMRLQPSEWRSGDIAWIIAAVGDETLTRQLIRRLLKQGQLGRSVKARAGSRQGGLKVIEITQDAPKE